MSGHAPEPRPSWWRPGLGSAAARDVGGAIYGLILATSIIAVSREYTPDNAGVTAITLVVTSSVFWLAHVYAEVLELELRDRRIPTWAEIRPVISEHWPLVQAGILPTTILVLGVAGVVADATAHTLALVSCVAELAIAGIVAARSAGGSGGLVIVSAAISLAFGLVIVALKVLVH